MSPESISAYMRNEAIDDCLFGINNCPIPVIIECSNGEEFPVEKAYRVSGKAAAIKILIGGEGKTNKLLDEIDDLKRDCKVFEDEKDNAESELEKAEKSLVEIEEKHEEELDKIENSLENAEQFLGIKTSERLIHYRIGEFARKINEKFDSLEEEREHFKRQIEELKVDNRALAWNISQLTEHENPTLN